MSEPIELRYQDGKLDEVVMLSGSVHLAYMDDNCVWMAFESDGKRVDVWLRARGKITGNAYDETPSPG